MVVAQCYVEGLVLQSMLDLCFLEHIQMVQYNELWDSTCQIYLYLVKEQKHCAKTLG